MFGKSFKFSPPAPFKTSEEGFTEDASGRKTTKKTFTYQNGVIVSIEFSEDGSFAISSNKKLKFNALLGSLKVAEQ